MRRDSSCLGQIALDPLRLRRRRHDQVEIDWTPQSAGPNGFYERGVGGGSVGDEQDARREHR
jgi:hypothetical protein